MLYLHRVGSLIFVSEYNFSLRVSIMKAFNLFAGTALVATSAVSLGIPGPTPTTFVQNESRHKKRQQAPFSVSLE